MSEEDKNLKSSSPHFRVLVTIARFLLLGKFAGQSKEKHGIQGSACSSHSVLFQLINNIALSSRSFSYLKNLCKGFEGGGRVFE